MDYIGYHRIGFKWALLLPACLLLFGFGCYATFDDATYLALRPDEPGHLLDYLPRPVLQAIMAVIMAALVVFIPLKIYAVVAKKISFAIRADGIHTYPIMIRKPGFIAWDDMRSVLRVKDTLTFKGYGRDGREVSIGFTPMGHSRKTVLAAIAHFRPDIAEGLR